MVFSNGCKWCNTFWVYFEKAGFDTAENETSKIWKILQKKSGVQLYSPVIVALRTTPSARGAPKAPAAAATRRDGRRRIFPTGAGLSEGLLAQEEIQTK